MVSCWELGPCSAGGGQGGVASGRVVPRVGIIVTEMTAVPEGVVRFYNGRGTAEQWIKEGKYALNWTRLSCHRFVANRVRLSLFVLAYNLGNFLRRAVSAQVGQTLFAAERAGQADQDGRPSGAARSVIDLSVVRGVGSPTVVLGSVGSYRPVIAGAKLREYATTILPRGRVLQGVGLSSMRFHPIGGGPEDGKEGQEVWFTARNRIPYWIDRRLTGLAGPEYHAIISFGLPFESEDCQYGKSQLRGLCTWISRPYSPTGCI